MRPSVGDYVKLTSRFVNDNVVNWSSALNGTRIHVRKLKLSKLTPFSVFTVYFVASGVLYTVDINRTGHFVDPNNNTTGSIVFEPDEEEGEFDEEEDEEEEEEQELGSVPAWVPNAPSSRPKPLEESETNCNCPLCGAPALDLAFLVQCTNSSCSNYRG